MFFSYLPPKMAILIGKKKSKLKKKKKKLNSKNLRSNISKKNVTPNE
jgi:hypothetical protein